MIAPNSTGISTGLQRAGLHGYDSLRYPLPTPAQMGLGDASTPASAPPNADVAAILQQYSALVSQVTQQRDDLYSQYQGLLEQGKAGQDVRSAIQQIVAQWQSILKQFNDRRQALKNQYQATVAKTPVGVSGLGDISTQDVGLIESLTGDATQAFISTQPSAVAQATYGGGTAGPLPPGVNAGSISFGGSTGVLLLIGLGLVAWGFSGRHRN